MVNMRKFGKLKTKEEDAIGGTGAPNIIFKLWAACGADYTDGQGRKKGTYEGGIGS